MYNHCTFLKEPCTLQFKEILGFQKLNFSNFAIPKGLRVDVCSINQDHVYESFKPFNKNFCANIVFAIFFSSFQFIKACSFDKKPIQAADA